MTLQEKIKKYGLTKDDWFQHKHYTILTRRGIDKVQAIEEIKITYEAVKVEAEFCVVKATGIKGSLKIETYGSAKYGGKTWNTAKKKWDEFGNTTTWYVMEMAEKRAMSRAVLKITGFYELGVFGEDESEDFKKEQQKPIERKPNLTQTGFDYLMKQGTESELTEALEQRRMETQQREQLTVKLNNINNQ